jgi:catalase
MPVDVGAVDHIIQQLKAKITERRQQEHLDFCPRDAHAHHHGIVTAEFTVASDLPAPLRVGLFATPKTYPAYIRFSNAGGEDHDADVDFRGMAIKVLGVEGERALPPLLPEDERTTQDFHLVNCPVFFAENPERMVTFLRIRADIRKARRERRWPRYWRLKIELAQRFPRTLQAGIVWNPLQVAYFSQTPYRWGSESVVKYQARPRRPGWPLSGSSNPIRIVVVEGVAFVCRRIRAVDYLRLAMARMIEQGHDILFDFLIQRQTDPLDMPIDDPTRLWDERRSAFIPVATIRIPARANRDFRSPTQMKLAEDMCFSPWHALQSHAPLGSVNEARREVYRRMAEYRHAKNGVHYTEPTRTVGV